MLVSNVKIKDVIYMDLKRGYRSFLIADTSKNIYRTGDYVLLHNFDDLSRCLVVRVSYVENIEPYKCIIQVSKVCEFLNSSLICIWSYRNYFKFRNLTISSVKSFIKFSNHSVIDDFIVLDNDLLESKK